MDHTQLKAVAMAIFGFAPEWSPSVCSALVERITALGVPPAVYLRAVIENLHVRGSKLRHGNVILAAKWDQFVPQQLQLMQEQARVRCDLDLLEFRTALAMCNGDYAEVLEDRGIDISDLGRYRIARLYGFEEVADKLAHAATADALANPFLQAKYDELGR